MKAFVEYGLDFDNNKFGFGRSVEIEYSDGSETRSKDVIKLKKQKILYEILFFLNSNWRF